MYCPQAVNSTSKVAVASSLVTVWIRVPSSNRGATVHAGLKWSGVGVVVVMAQDWERRVHVELPVTVSMPAGSGSPSAMDPGTSAVSLATQFFRCEAVASFG